MSAARHRADPGSESHDDAVRPVVSRLELAQIVSRAATIFERLENQSHHPRGAPEDAELAEVRLTRWREVVASGDWAEFERRLHWEGLNLEGARVVLAHPPAPNSEALPEWALLLGEIITAGALVPPSDPHSDLRTCLDPRPPVPFEEALVPILSTARSRLIAHLETHSLPRERLFSQLICEDAYASLELGLLQRLIELTERTLGAEFSDARPYGYRVHGLLMGDPAGQSDRTHYDAFIRTLLRDGLLSFFQKYPVLARFTATAVEHWVEATSEFIQRLATDLPDIARLQASGEGPNAVSPSPPGRVARARSSLSDPHHRGRCVIALSFESGLNVIYKPRDMGPEVAFFRLLDWCNQRGALLEFKVLKVVDRVTHGWVQQVEHVPCPDDDSAHRFYQRAGMQLALLHALGGTDCHRENLIAAGEHPVLIDLETLLQHGEQSMDVVDGARSADVAVDEDYWSSVLRTGMLPRWETGAAGAAFDISGLGSADADQAPVRFTEWRLINTDDMYVADEKRTIPPLGNFPVLRGVPLSSSDYLDDILEGFARSYRFLMAQRPNLLASDGPTSVLRRKRMRYLFRATRVYATVLNESFAPQYLRDGADWSIEMDILSRALLLGANNRHALPVLQAELRALARIDVPHFSAAADSHDLTDGLVQPIRGYFKESAQQQLTTRLQNLSEADLTCQVALIRGAFQAKVARAGEPAVLLSGQSAGSHDDREELVLSSARYREQACAIGEEIAQRAIHGDDGSVTWMDFNYLPHADRFQLQPVTDSLYDGRCGIALFLSALDYVTGENRFRDLAVGAVQGIRHGLRTSDSGRLAKLPRRIGIGGATGVGSMVYALVRISRFLGDEALLQDAQRAAELISFELIARDRDFDVMSGTAGAMLALLALYHETSEPLVLDQARACGDHLVERRAAESGPRAWKSAYPRPLTGFSHGAAGIAYALTRMYEASGEGRYLEAALEGVEYERVLFSPAAGNWPDLRPGPDPDQPGFMVSWCHGAAGIGLARLGCLPHLRSAETEREIGVALGTTEQYGCQGVDHLCCGVFGRCELLLVASQTLSRPALRAAAHQQAARSLSRAAQAGGFALFSNVPAAYSPSLFRGTAGIGYQLLRLAEPDRVPSILLLS
jgi:type 2 lantibiotic biosynthesis protein LanM